MRATGSSGGSRRTWLLLILIVAGGAALRIWYASAEPSPIRFWDERYSLENVQSILDTGSFRPARGFYPSPLVSWPQAGLLAASERLHRATGHPAFAIRSGREYTATTYLLVRSLSVLFGTVSLILIFLVGRRLYSERVGLLAALLLAFCPWHIRVSGVFKPDALLVLTLLLTLYWTVAAVREGRRLHYVLAGVGIALSLSAKITGGMIALALVAGSLAGGWRDPRRWRLLLLAAVVSLVLFFLLNPYGIYYLSYLQHLQDDYDLRADMKEMSRWQMPARILDYLVGRFVHGPLVGGLALLGAALMALRLVAPGSEPRERSRAALLLVFPLAFVFTYVALTPHFKGNNLLPIVPFTAILAAWVMAGGWGWAERRLSPPARPLVAAVALAALALAVLPLGFIYVYRSLTPTTLDAAKWLLGRRVERHQGPYVFAERWRDPEPAWEGRERRPQSRLILRSVDRLDQVPHRTLNRADGEIFPSARLVGEGSDFYRRRIERVATRRVVTLRARPFRLRGPDVVAIRHRRKPKLGPLRLEAGAGEGGCLRIELPAAVAGSQTLSLVFAVLQEDFGEATPALEVAFGERPVDAWTVATPRQVVTFATERFPTGAGQVRVCAPPAPAGLSPARTAIELYGWRGRRER